MYNSIFKAMSSVTTGKDLSSDIKRLFKTIDQTPISPELDNLKLSHLIKKIFHELAGLLACADNLDLPHKKFIFETVMTVLTMYRAFPVKGELDTKTITEPGVEFNISLLDEEIKQSVARLFSSLSDETKSALLRLLTFQIYHSNKASPNGNITENWIADTAAVLNSDLYPKVVNFVKQLDNSDQALVILEDIKSRLQDVATNKKHSKISYFQEGGGKIRIVAVVD